MQCIISSSRRPDITFHPSGKIDISARIVRTLSLRHGDVVNFAINDRELLLFVEWRSGAYSGRRIGAVHPTGGPSGTFRTHSRVVTHKVLAASGSSSPLRCFCGTPFVRDSITFIPIITRNPL